jgi:hypothetical protein
MSACLRSQPKSADVTGVAPENSFESHSARSRAMSSWTEQLGPRSQIHDHDSHSETGSDLRTLRAAYRNRTDDLRITRVSPCVARGFESRASFMFAGCCWCRSLAVDGCSGASRGHALVMRRPGSRWGGAVERPSAFQAGHVPSCYGSSGRCAWSPVAAVCRWLLLLLLLLLSRLLSIRRWPSGSKPTRTLQGMARVRSGQAPAWPLVSGRSVR